MPVLLTMRAQAQMRQGKYCDVGGNNARACIDMLPDTLRRFKVRNEAIAA